MNAKALILRNSIALLLAIFVFNSCKEKEDEPFRFPTDQVELILEDGAIVGSEIQSSNFYKTTLPGGKSVKIFYGNSADNIIWELAAGVKSIDPYTKYYWHAAVYDIATKEYSEFSETRAFYSIGTLSLEYETDNGETENAIMVRWKNFGHSRFSNMKVQMTPTKDCGFAGKIFDVPAGQDSFYIKWSDNTEMPYLINDYDDEKGQDYEPVIYKIQLTADIQIEDKTFPVKSSNGIREIFLNKSTHVRDHEFNVYRVVKIGNRQWLADDLRTKSFIYKGDTIKLDDIEFDQVYDSEQPAPYKTIKLTESGSTGITYCVGDYWGERIRINGLYDGLNAKGLISLLAPKGYHISNNADWEDLERYYGVESPEIAELKYGYFPRGYVAEECFEDIRENYVQYFQGGDVELRRRLSSNTDWIYYDPNETPNADYIQSAFNAKPFAGKGYGCIYYTLMVDEHKQNTDIVFLFRVLSTVDKGILNMGDEIWIQGDHSRYASLRCVKD